MVLLAFKITINRHNQMKRVILTIAVILLSLSLKAQYNKEIVKQPLMQSDTTYSGQHINFPSGNAVISISKVTIPAGCSTGWHKHDNHVFAYVQQGTLTLELENGYSKEFKKDSTFAEVVNTPHNGVNRGNEDVVLIVFQTLPGKNQTLPGKK
ncbi:MAG: cupin domain-containing protein [Rikenellaceae bacterium]|nr:cupin domain-containing protein [Rikenellaceae bacterium]